MRGSGIEVEKPPICNQKCLLNLGERWFSFRDFLFLLCSIHQNYSKNSDCLSSRPANTRKCISVQVGRRKLIEKSKYTIDKLHGAIPAGWVINTHVNLIKPGESKQWKVVVFEWVSPPLSSCSSERKNSEDILRNENNKWTFRLPRNYYYWKCEEISCVDEKWKETASGFHINSDFWAIRALHHSIAILVN